MQIKLKAWYDCSLHQKVCVTLGLDPSYLIFPAHQVPSKQLESNALSFGAVYDKLLP